MWVGVVMAKMNGLALTYGTSMGLTIITGLGVHMGQAGIVP